VDFASLDPPYDSDPPVFVPMSLSKTEILILVVFAVAAGLLSRGGRCESCCAIDLHTMGHDRAAEAGR
jgi:hypothetical protein